MPLPVDPVVGIIGVLIALGVGVYAVKNRQAIGNKIAGNSNGTSPASASATGAAVSPDIFKKLIADISSLPLVVKVTQETDDLRRSLDSAMITKLRHRVEVLTDDGAKQKGYDALDTLSLIVLVPRNVKPPVDPNAV